MTSNSRFRVTARALLSAGLLLGALTPAASHAGPIGWTLAGGRYDGLAGADQPYFASVGARMGLGQLTVTPNAEWLFVDGARAYTLNLDVTMVIVPAGAASLWVGGGYGSRTVEPEGGVAVTDGAMNVLVGGGLNLAPIKPFAQVKWVIDDGDTPVALMLGLRF